LRVVAVAATPHGKSTFGFGTTVKAKIGAEFSERAGGYIGPNGGLFVCGLEDMVINKKGKKGVGFHSRAGSWARGAWGDSNMQPKEKALSERAFL